MSVINTAGIGRILRNRLIAATAIAAVLVSFGAIAKAQEAVGKASRVKNQVSGSMGQRQLAVADPVHRSERISAGVDSFGEMLLIDDSKVLVGENSEVSLDRFVVSEGGIKAATLNVTKGAFRFISGNSEKGTFQIRTPLSTIGVRGTIFDVYVTEGGVTNVVLLRGAVRVCDLERNCMVADRSCDIIEVKARNEIEEKPFLRSAMRGAGEERQAFGLLHGQQRFSQQWQAPTIACNQRAAIEAQEGLRNRNPGAGQRDTPPEPEPDDEYPY